jgi:hypothetical protein
MKNATMIPSAIPPNTPPAIAGVFGGVVLLSAFAIEFVGAEESVTVLVAPVSLRAVLVRVMPPATKEGEGGQGLTRKQVQKHQYQE